MSNQWNDFDDIEDSEGGQQQRKGNGLRDKLEAALAENRALKERVGKAESAARQATVSNLVKDKGLDPKIVRLMPADIEPSEEAIGKWLDEFGDLFVAKTAEETPADQGAGESDEDEGDEFALGIRQMQGVQASATTPVKNSDQMAKLMDPNLTRDQLLQMVLAAGGGPGI